MMKRLIFVMLPLLGLLMACNNETRTIEEDKAELASYLADNNISVEPRESGLYYIEQVEGSQFPVKDGEFIIFKYSLKTIGGIAHDTDQLYWIDVTNYDIIIGLIEGLSLMKEGSKATIIIPPHLAYGGGEYNGIEPNTTLVFDIEILEVKGEEEEEIRLQKFIADSGITVTPTASGVYFIETDHGIGDSIMVADTLNIKYKGMYLDGTVFDQTKDDKYFKYVYKRTSVIKGFEEGIGLMKHSGKARFIIPYTEGYGESGSTGVMPYSTLIFDIELIGK